MVELVTCEVIWPSVALVASRVVAGKGRRRRKGGRCATMGHRRCDRTGSRSRSSAASSSRSVPLAGLTGPVNPARLSRARTLAERTTRGAQTSADRTQRETTWWTAQTSQPHAVHYTVETRSRADPETVIVANLSFQWPQSSSHATPCTHSLQGYDTVWRLVIGFVFGVPSPSHTSDSAI